MALKRKRNLKVDVAAKYSIHLLEHLDAGALEDYVETHDTGMEADEEKEIQLQSIIRGSGASIPLPVIERVPNPARAAFVAAEARHHIKWNRDVRNEYIGDCGGVPRSTEPLPGAGGSAAMGGADEAGRGPLDGDGLSPQTSPQVLERAASPHTGSSGYTGTQSTGTLAKIGRESEQMSEAFRTFGNAAGSTKNHGEGLINYVLNRTLLRYERPGFEAYACFRQRVFHPSFKSRRNETIMLEKLEMMGMEFYALSDLCTMMLSKAEKELQHLRLTAALVEEYCAGDLTRRMKRAYRQKILEVPDDPASDKLLFNVHSIMTNRDKISVLRKARPSYELPLDTGCYKSVMALLHQPKRAAPAQLQPPKPKKTCRMCREALSGPPSSDNRNHNV
ncbi:hypothetical protein PAPHI01_0846 [Pancytospora philotis]|nr:hypothetical protein PAPHI01_0846 [Pancytospora philotis]